MASQLTKAGATAPNIAWTGRLEVWRGQHKHQATESLQELVSKPLATSIVLLVLAIAILLPTFLYIGLKNAENWMNFANKGLEINVYLALETSDSQAQRLTQQLAELTEVESAIFISPKEAAQSLSSNSEVSDIIESLPFNPLPPTIKVSLSTIDQLESAAQTVVDKTSALEGVESVAFNIEWFRKAEAILHVLQRLTSMLALVLGLGVALVIGNTIRLAIEARKEEIQVAKLVGATDGFVRRPFLYMGSWLGALGAICACCLAYIGMFALTYFIKPIEKAYATDISLSNLPITSTLLIIASCSILGWLASWVICNNQIRKLDPQ